MSAVFPVCDSNEQLGRHLVSTAQALTALLLVLSSVSKLPRLAAAWRHFELTAPEHRERAQKQKNVENEPRSLAESSTCISSQVSNLCTQQIKDKFYSFAPATDQEIERSLSKSRCVLGPE